jgi:Zn-dependent protease
MTPAEQHEDVAICSECSATLPASALSCPQCRRLTHSSELEELARQARAAWQVGNFAAERAFWQQSMPLLPPDTVQHRSIQARIAEIEQLIPSSVSSHRGSLQKASMGLGPILLLLLTKGKLLLLGLTKMSTLVTMFASLGVYWSLYGWAFALGLVLSIYIHEMGHVIAIRGYGLPASAPMFIPGFGAFIRLRAVKLPPVPDARIGLAGPIYGLGAALAALTIYLVTHGKMWGVIAHFGAVINLFNLIPVWQLDGARGIRSLTRFQRGVVLSAATALWLISGTPMLLLIAGVLTYRMFTRDWAAEPDRPGLTRFVGLLVALSAVAVMAPLQ